MYSRILVPLDGSELSEVALPYAEELACRLETQVTLFQVLTLPYHEYPIKGEVALVPYTDEEMKLLKANARDYLKKAGFKLRKKGIPVKTEVVIGSAAREIIRLADTTKADMVVMSTHGRSGITRWVLGSVASKVVMAAKQPVALIRAKGARPSVREKDILDKVLAPLDGSKESEVVLPHIVELASKFKAEVTLFHMFTAAYSFISEDSFGEEQLKKLESMRTFAKEYIEKVAAQLKRNGISAKANFKEVIMGTEAEEIIKLADEIQADVIAMSTHGRSGIGLWALGSVAEKVLHAGNAPLFLVREAKAGTH